MRKPQLDASVVLQTLLISISLFCLFSLPSQLQCMLIIWHNENPLAFQKHD